MDESMEFRHVQLPNGLNVVAEVNPSAATMAAAFFVRTGSRDESPDIAGVSHFLEHMVFKGTERRSALDVNREFDELGASYNANTSEENTIFYGAVLPEFQHRLVDLLGDILRPSLRGDDFDVEKHVILDEIAMYEDLPNVRLYDQLMERHFAPHPLGNSILGTRRTIGELPAGRMREYFARRYTPGNITVVGAGNLDFDALAAQVAQLCGHWLAGEARRACEPAGGAKTTTILVDPKVARQHVGLMSAGPSRQDDRRFAANVLATILGDSTGSRLYYALVETAIADEASLHHAPMDGAGAFITFFTCDAARASEATAIARGILSDFAAAGSTDDELAAARNKLATAATLQGELPMGRLASVGGDWVYRRQYMPLTEQVERILAVTGQQVRQVAREFDIAAVTTVALGPAESL